MRQAGNWLSRYTTFTSPSTPIPYPYGIETRYPYPMPRQFPTSTPLGRRMNLLAYTATEFAAVSGIHPRTLTEYLAGRAEMTPEHRDAAAEALGVHPDDL